MLALKKIGYFSAFIIPALVILGYYLDGWFNYLAILQVFIMLPIIDHLIGTDTTNIPKEKTAFFSNEYYYRFITYIWTYFQLGFVIWSCYVITQGNIDTWYEWAGFTLSFSLVTGGIGITVAHELGHKKSLIERFYSQVLLMTVGYMHFYIEHNRGHHVMVATKEDPATALKNEGFYAFWLKSVFQGFFHAWKLEFERMNKLKKPRFSLSNNMIWFSILPVTFVILLTLVFSYLGTRFYWEIPLFMTLQSLLAFTLLELVNYVEHYGIQRKEISPGRYERMMPIHSWNSNHLISNFFLFQLQRHSDHHANAIKRYQALNHYEESPQLPAGYPTMVLLALLPPLWFHFMNPRLEQWHGGKAVLT